MRSRAAPRPVWRSCCCAAGPHAHRAQDPPRILLDQPLAAVEYQLGRLTNEELILVERKDGRRRSIDPCTSRMLDRKGSPAQYRDEALAALTEMDKASRSRVLLDALAKVPPGRSRRGRQAAGPALRAAGRHPAHRTRDLFSKAIDGAPGTLRRARRVWRHDDRGRQARSGLAGRDRTRRSDRSSSCEAVPQLPLTNGGGDLRAQLFTPISALVASAKDRQGSRAGAGRPRVDPARRRHIRSPGAAKWRKARDASASAAALRSLQGLPEDAWPAASVEPLARAILARVGALAADARRSPTRSKRFSSANASRRSSRQRPDGPSGATCARSACRSSASRPCRRNSVSTCGGSPSRPASPCRSCS